MVSACVCNAFPTKKRKLYFVHSPNVFMIGVDLFLASSMTSSPRVFSLISVYKLCVPKYVP